MYALGADTDETARLQRQSDELQPEARALLARLGELGLRPGQAALDLGCGPRGILDLLAEAVGPGGRVVGLDADPAHVTAARQFAFSQGLANVEVLAGDARHTGLPAASFDLVHTRTLLVTIPEPAEVVAEMARLARPGGLGGEPGGGCRIQHLLSAAARMGPALGTVPRQLPPGRGRPAPGAPAARVVPRAGLTDVGATVYAGSYPAGHSRRTVIPDLVRSLHPVILGLGLAGERELADVDGAVRTHLADPRTLVMPHLLVTAWGRKP